MATATAHNEDSKALWNGGGSPFKVSYGKIMIWFISISIWSSEIYKSRYMAKI
jgi:hypothetical protein